MSKTKQDVFITNNSRETQKLGAKFARILLAQAVQGVSLSGNNVIALYGNLGSGKTTFVQGLARGLGVKKRIISPTFIIVRTYKISSEHQALSIKHFYHIDLYRIESEKEVQELGIEEILSGKDIIVVEWAEKMQNLLPKKRWDVEFKDLGSSRRKITINQKL